LQDGRIEGLPENTTPESQIFVILTKPLSRDEGPSMAYQLVLVVSPCLRGRIRIGTSRYAELHDATEAAAVPDWLVAAARAAWSWILARRPERALPTWRISAATMTFSG
jgi:hypothetical protein